MCFKEKKFDFYFKDLKPKALITNLPSNHPSIKISYKNTQIYDSLYYILKKKYPMRSFQNLNLSSLRAFFLSEQANVTHQILYKHRVKLLDPSRI